MNTLALNLNQTKRRETFAILLIRVLIILMLAMGAKEAWADQCGPLRTIGEGYSGPQGDIATVPSTIAPGTQAGKLLTSWRTVTFSVSGCNQADFPYGATSDVILRSSTTKPISNVDGGTNSYLANVIGTMNGIDYVGIIYEANFNGTGWIAVKAILNNSPVAIVNPAQSSMSLQVRYALVALTDIPQAGGVIDYAGGLYGGSTICKVYTSGGKACLNYDAFKSLALYRPAVKINASTTNVPPLTCTFLGSGVNGGLLDLSNVSLGTNFNASTFSASNPGNWVGAGMKLEGACEASQIDIKFASGPGYTSPAGNANVFGAKVGAAADPGVGVELRRKDNSLSIKPNDTQTWNPPFATGTDFVEARLVKVGAGTPLVGNGTSVIQATMTYY